MVFCLKKNFLQGKNKKNSNMSHDLRHVARTFAAKSTTCLTKNKGET